MKTKVKILLSFTGLFFATMTGYTQSFNANPDTVYLTPGIKDTVDLLANDLIPPGDSIFIQYVHFNVGSGGIWYDFVNPERTLVEFMAQWRLVRDGMSTATYLLRRKNTTDTSSAAITFFVHDESIDSIDLNNVNARFMSCGYHHAPMNNTCFEVPKGSGKGTIFAHSIWIGGKDQDDQLHLAGYRYGQGPTTAPAFTKSDFWSGPVMDSASYTVYTDTIWNYIWKLSKSEIDYHKANWNQPGYQPIHDILTWPGNGNVLAGQAAQLAPFFDVNGDGIYDPLSGDFPNIRGDQALYFIFNDDRDIHSETEGNKLRAEIHAMAYVFNIPGDTAFDNTVFLYYRIVNRSANTYSNSYFGVFGDMDIGYANDDYFGCDVERGMFIGYNGTPVDGSGQPEAYGEHPPAQAIVFLAGPLLSPDERDNPAYVPGNCDVMNTGYPLDPYAINGAGFGDTVVDNERMGMTNFVSFLNGGPAYMSDPKYASEYYLFLQSIWGDSEKMIYGGNGHAGAGGYGPECNFMFPGLSDGCDWGTNGQTPNGEKNWTETTAGNNPFDRRGLGSVGPFTLLPGEEVEVDLAYTFARDTTAGDTSLSLGLLGRSVDKIRHAFLSNTLPNGSSFLGIAGEPAQQTWHVTIYPNPASSAVNIMLPSDYTGTTTIRVVDTRGIQVQSMAVPENTGYVYLDVSGLPSGLFFLVVQSGDRRVTEKLVIIR
jgi:hypothetical protein